MAQSGAVEARRYIVWFGEEGESVSCLGGVFVLEGFFLAEFRFQSKGRQEAVSEFSADVPEVVLVFELE